MSENHFFKKMLLSDTEDEWSTAYKDASNVLKDYTLKMEKLKDIYDHPSFNYTVTCY